MRAHVFDMDGTLLHGTTASLLLAGALGGGDGLAALERRFASGTLTAVEFARELHAMWGVVAPVHALGRAPASAAPGALWTAAIRIEALAGRARAAFAVGGLGPFRFAST